MSAFSITTFVINLPKRIDRRENIHKQFKDRCEFAYQVVEPVADDNPKRSLWKTIIGIIQQMSNCNDEFVLICEDDHQFTEHYEKQTLRNAIERACALNCDILLGGASCIKSTFEISKGLLWIEDFTGLQFSIIFRSLFQRLLDFEFGEHDDADIAISRMTQRKMLTNPFVSIQFDFGYSDVTTGNNSRGRVEHLFTASSERVAALNCVQEFYRNSIIGNTEDLEFDNIYLPTYIIGYSSESGQVPALRADFSNKNEFDLASSDWNFWVKSQEDYAHALKIIVRQAITNDDEIIVICNDKHAFSSSYRKSSMLQCIVEAHYHGADILLGGLETFDSAVFISSNKFWVSNFSGGNFIVLYRKFFQRIIDEPFDTHISVESVLSEMTSHKFVHYPVMSITENQVEPKADYEHLIEKEDFFKSSSRRLYMIQKAYLELTITNP